MSLVFKHAIDGPTTHAIVIGIGDYDYLPGGKGQPTFPDHRGMGQLTSPPHSARAFARWLLDEYRNQDKPLSSLELLISDSDSSDFTASGGEVTSIERANLDNVDRAVLAWKDRGDTNRGHLMILYFCGHGISSGLVTSLLLEDFGQRLDRPLKQAIDLNGLYLGMDKCEARQQCYFIDACRVASPLLVETYNYTGDPIIYGSALHSPVGKRFAPIYYSTVAGSRAYGRSGEPSVFTNVLLKALRGAGSDDVEGDWRVDTDTLNRGISYLLERALDDEESLDQVSPVDGLTRFTLHYLEGQPIVPVAIGCRPDKANEVAELSYALSDGANEVVREEMEPSEWDVDIGEGDYRFSARFPGGLYRNNERKSHVRPPFRPIRIEVQS